MNEENTLSMEMDMDNFVPDNTNAMDEITFENSEPENTIEETTTQLDDTEEENNETEEVESNEQETENLQNDYPEFKNGLNELDIKRWAEQYKCSEQDVLDALDMGWHGEQGFSKNKKFLDPVAFVEKSKANGSIMYNKLQQQKETAKKNEQMYKALMDIQKKTNQDALEQANAKIQELERQLKEAKDDFDVEKVEKIALEKVKAESQAKLMEIENNKSMIPNGRDYDFEEEWVKTSATMKKIVQDPSLFNEFKAQVWMLDNIDDYQNWTSQERIAHLERKFGQKAFTRPEATTVGHATSGAVNNTVTWADVPNEFKQLSLDIARDMPWYSIRETNPEAKKIWENYKKDIINSYKQTLRK